MNKTEAYKDFLNRFKHLIQKSPELIKTTLSNIFTMRLIGNKTHGDLAEIGISEFVNQYMYDFRSDHVGKDMYRAKEHEEDIKITNEINKVDFPISLKAYGDGPLQLSTDKNFKMFPMIKAFGNSITAKSDIQKILSDKAFLEFEAVNVMPLIYREKERKCNIMVFSFEKAKASVAKIALEVDGKRRKHPCFRFFDLKDQFICEVRYGDGKANALQRGLWTHTKNALSYFDSVTGGWVDYSDNLLLVKLFSHALVSSERGHKRALEEVKQDISELRKSSGLREKS